MLKGNGSRLLAAAQSGWVTFAKRSAWARRSMATTILVKHPQLLNTASEAELGRILRDYGEEKLWRVVARRCVGGGWGAQGRHVVGRSLPAPLSCLRTGTMPCE